MTVPSYVDRLAAAGPKRILSIDGGGVRGALAVGILRQLETVLRDRYGRPDMVLSDYFDLIGGTSTGAIIAAGLALGRDTANLESVYRRLGPEVFRRFGLRLPLVQARFDPRRLEAMIRRELGEATLGTAAWRTGFAAIAKRVDTGSSWVLTNCPKGKYWLGDPDEIAREPDSARRVTIPNRDYPLAKVVQASAAAPFFFDLVAVEVEQDRPGVFFDGAMTPHGNPTLQLAMTALIPAYGLGWAAGEDQLLIISVGTGAPRPIKPKWVRPPLISVWKALQGLISMVYDASQLAITTLQWLGTSPQPWHVNGEIGNMRGSRPAGMAPLWTFLRYDAPLEEAWLKQELDHAATPAALGALQRLDDDRQIPALFQIGLAAGARQVKAEHLPAAFDPPPLGGD